MIVKLVYGGTIQDLRVILEGDYDDSICLRSWPDTHENLKEAITYLKHVADVAHCGWDEEDQS